jgi:hypothetical protein
LGHPAAHNAVGAIAQTRESNDSPTLDAFCRVAPSLRFKVRAILAAGIFFRASGFSSRTCAAVHTRFFDAFAAI